MLGALRVEKTFSSILTCNVSSQQYTSLYHQTTLATLALLFSGGRELMVRAWNFAIAAACHAGSNPAWGKFIETQHISPSQSWDIVSMLCPWARHFTLKCFTWLRWKWGLVGQRWQCVRLVQYAEMAAGLYALRGVEMAHEWTGPERPGV